MEEMNTDIENEMTPDELRSRAKEIEQEGEEVVASEDTEPCADCEEPIDPTLRECPECGNNPSSAKKKGGAIAMIAGFVLTITMVGAVVGIPVFLLGMILFLVGGKEMAVDNVQ